MKKMAIFCLHGLDNFLDWAEPLSAEYEIKKVVTSTHTEVYRAMEWADILWCEWCNEMAVNVTRHMINIKNANHKKVVVRLHSYEVFTELPNCVIWEDVERLVFVAPHVEKIARDRFPNMLNCTKTEIVFNGVDINSIPFLNTGNGFNIAVVGSITHKKNPAMVLQILNKLKQIDDRYTVHWAGAFQESRYETYLKYMINEMGLEDNVIFYGQLTKEQMTEFWKGKNYLLHTSVHEGHSYSIMEAMARGIKPAIHNFLGCNDLYPKACLYNTVDEAINIVRNNDYKSNSYRSWIELKKWTLEHQVSEYKRIIAEMR